MDWYLRQVWPLIRQRVPQAEMRIAGVVPASLVRDWNAVENVHLLGFADDLRSEYEKAAVVATPVTWGGGTKIKVLEALAYGRVPVGTKHAFEGLADSGRLEIIAAIDEAAVPLAEATVEMIINVLRRRSCEIAAIQYFADNYSIERFNMHVEDIVITLMRK